MTASPVALDAQMVINCQAGGSCNGGNPGDVYEFAHTTGLVHGSCMNYVAYNDQSGICQDISVCRDCHGPAPAVGDDGLANCTAVEPDTRYYVDEYYEVRGADKMKAELQNGPISCGIHATDNFETNYDGKTIYSEKVKFLTLNHEISVIGYGVTDSGEEYWIGRNSWGTYWGDYGFFYMAMHKDNLGIERNCVAGSVTYDKPKSTIEAFVQ